MASSGVLPWLVGLPATDTAWDAAPARDTLDATSPVASLRSEPNTMRSRATNDMEGTVNRRAQSSSPAKQQSLAWKKRLVDGKLGYGDQTDLFGPSGLENIFTKTQVADSGSQKKHRPMGLGPRLSTDQKHENSRPSTGYKKQTPILSMPSSPPITQNLHDQRTSEDSAESSPASQTSQSSVADVLSEMMGKMNELSESNKGYQSRMQAIKERLGDSGELRQELERAEHEKQQAKGSWLYQKGQFDKGSAELLQSQRKVFDFARQTISAERGADSAKSERRQLAEGYNMSKRALSHTRQEADDWKEKYEEAQSELESLRSGSPKSEGSVRGPSSPRSEIITKQAEKATSAGGSEPANELQNDYSEHEPEPESENKSVRTGNEFSTNYKPRSASHLAPPTTDAAEATGNRSITDSELEDLTPVFIAKRTASNGKVSFNAIRSENSARSDIIKQRKDIDKTETSQRARELELAMGAEESEPAGQEQNAVGDDSEAADHAEGQIYPHPSFAGADDESQWIGTRHVSGFTDAPEVEEDMPVQTKESGMSATWDFSEPPQNESSELAAVHKQNETLNKRSVSFGIQQLNDFAFKIVDQTLEDATEATVEETEAMDSSVLSNSANPNALSREDSPELDVEAPGSRMPFVFRKDSLADIHTTNSKPRRNFSKGSTSASFRARNLSLPKTRSPPQAGKSSDISDIELRKTRSPPQVYVEDTEDPAGIAGALEGKRPLPRSPLKSPTPKRRRTLHDSELQSVTEANVSYHSQLQDAISTRKHKDSRHREAQNVAKPDVLAQRKMARPRNGTPTQGPATKDYINEAKKVIELLRGNNTPSSVLGGITEADESDSEESQDDPSESEQRKYPTYNSHRSDNMRTLAPQQVAHLIGGEMHGMTYDKTKNCWIRSKSFEHKQFLDPRDALSSDDDPFREISDLTVEKSMNKTQPIRPSQEMGATTVVHHEYEDTGLSFGDVGDATAGADANRQDSPQQSDPAEQPTPKLPGEDTTLAQYDNEHESDLSDLTQTTEISTPAPLPSQIIFPSPPNRVMPAEVARLQLATSNPNANINNTFLLSDLPDFTVHEEDRERPSERALATRLASYAAVEISDPYTLATSELVKAITDVQGQQIHWEDLTSLSLHDKSLKSLHSLEDHCSRVEKLDVSANALTQLDGVPPFVRQLNAQSNQLVSLTSWAHLMHLQYLDSSNNNLDSLDGLGHLIHLRELRVDNNKVQRLDGIADLDGLITLSARNNAIRSVDFNHFQFGRLVDLDLSNNDITSGEGLEDLTSLRTLKLDKNPIGRLEVTQSMLRLKHLSLRSCGLESFSVVHFPNLRTLTLDENSLSTIHGISGLKKLDFLSMSSQRLESKQRITILNGTLEAQKICLSHNTISFLGLDYPLMSVKHLDLSDTGLAALPANIGVQLPNLRALDLSFNGLKDIRPLAPLSGLESLSLVGCRIDRLRKTVATVGKLGKLKSLDMRQTPLTQGFYGPNFGEDCTYKAKLDEETAIRRRTYELLVAYSCSRDGFTLDGLDFDAEAAVAKDGVWERLVELGVLRRVE